MCFPFDIYWHKLSNMPSQDPTERLMKSLSVLSPHLQRVPGPDEIPPDLSPGTARVLLEISLADADLAVGDLATRLRVPHPRVSRLLGELEDLGLIKRARDQQDRRRVTVQISPDGCRFAAALRSAHRDRLAQLLEVLGVRDTEQLVRIFERAASRLRFSDERAS